jgi:hypothetical protein
MHESAREQRAWRAVSCIFADCAQSHIITRWNSFDSWWKRSSLGCVTSPSTSPAASPRNSWAGVLRRDDHSGSRSDAEGGHLLSPACSEIIHGALTRHVRIRRSIEHPAEIKLQTIFADGAESAWRADFGRYAKSIGRVPLESERSKKYFRSIIEMSNDVQGNCIKTHRRRCGLSQRELGILIGYGAEDRGAAVGRHERSNAAPPLLIALAYEIVFETPASQLFSGFHAAVAQSVARNFEELKAELTGPNGEKKIGNIQKRQWLEKQRIG